MTQYLTRDSGGERPPDHPISPDLRIDGVFERGAIAAAGMLVGFGLILFVAANWDGISKWQRFGLVGGIAVTAALGAAGWPKARTPLSLAGIMAIGGLLATIGQTYQTGADNWQLFAVWACATLLWAIAARSDAVWALWTTVAYTALLLWWQTEAGMTYLAKTPATIAVWMTSLAMTAFLSPLLGISPWIGKTKWAFRLSAVLFAIVVTGHAAVAIWDMPKSTMIALLGFLLIGAALAAVRLARPLDVPLLTVFALALDVLLISLVARGIFSSAHWELGPMLAAGLISALIVAGSAAILLGDIRGVVASGAERAAADKLTDAKAWPVVLMTFIGALIAAVPLIIFLVMAIGTVLQKGPVVYFLAACLTIGATALLRGATPLGFRQQFGIIALVMSFFVMGYAFYRDTPGLAASLGLLTVAAGLSFFVPNGWIKALLGALAAFFATLAIAQGISMARGLPFLGLWGISSGWPYSLMAGSIAMMFVERDKGATLGEQASQGLGRFLTGWVAAGLLFAVYSANSTFLLGSWWGAGGIWPLKSLALPGFSAVAVLGLVVAVGGCYWLAERHPKLNTPTGYAVAALLLILTAVAPTIGFVILALAAAATSGRRALALLAVFAILWMIGAFYYDLGWPLTHKALLMFGLGAGLGAVAWRNAKEVLALPALGHESAWELPAAAAMIFASLVGTAAAAGLSIAENEHTLKTGRTVFVELGQVDPRSLIQGDYMALSFRIPPEAAPKDAARSKATVVVAIDEKGVATFKPFADPAVIAGSNEAALNIERRRWSWTMRTNAWFFKEGAAPSLAQARFGEFRISNAGTALLVGLADENLKSVAQSVAVDDVSALPSP